MQIQIVDTAPESVQADALALMCFEAPSTKVGGSNAVQQENLADPPLAAQDGWLAELRASNEFSGKLYETAVLYRPRGCQAKRLVVVGGGPEHKFSAVEARRIAGLLVRQLKPKGVQTVALVLDRPGMDATARQATIEAAVEGAVLGSWEPDKYKTDTKKSEKTLEAFLVATSKDGSHATEATASTARFIAEAQNEARDLVNEPGNRLTPALLVEAARHMCAEVSLECEVLDQQQMQALGMGALLGVARGSSNPPFLIVMKYRPARTFSEDHLALIGKGVTFDTGGISIKHADGMEKMKYDMAGAAAVIGAMRAIAQMKPSVTVTGFIPTVENMINGDAMRPGDVVTSLAGKTIEVLNTDAEGRLILADAITYAKQHGATHIVDAATLTGAIGIALGHYNMGAFTNDETLMKRFFAAAEAAGEKAWQLPMDEEYKDYLKSAFADLPNVGGRHAGSITAAWFLREFADPTPWVHLDIASTAWLDDAKPWMSKGPSGVGVRSFIRLARDWSSGVKEPSKQEQR